MDGFDAGRGRWIVGGCFAIFAVPFFIAGVAIINTGLRELNRGQRDAAILLGAGIAFTAFSAGIVALVWYGLRRAQAAAQLRAAHPMQPWLWRADWSARRIEESATSRAAALLVFALMWNAIALPLLIVRVHRDGRRRREPHRPRRERAARLRDAPAGGALGAAAPPG